MKTYKRNREKPAWYVRHEKLVQWLTLISVIGGGIFHWMFVDLPAKRLLEQQATLAVGTIEQQSIEKIKRVDNFVDSLTPSVNLVINPDVTWSRKRITGFIEITNKGSRAIYLSRNWVDMRIRREKPNFSNLPIPLSKDITVTTTGFGLISPGETIKGNFVLNASGNLDGVDTVQVKLDLVLTTRLDKKSLSAEYLEKEYDADYIKSLLSKPITFTGIFSRG